VNLTCDWAVEGRCIPDLVPRRCQYSATRYCNNNHNSEPKMEEAQKRKVHCTKIILPKKLKLNLNPLGPTDYNSIPT
jgi:hypothetical protein